MRLARRPGDTPASRCALPPAERGLEHRLTAQPGTRLHPDDETLLSRLDERERRANGVPEPDVARQREQAFLLVRDRIAPAAPQAVLRVSPLGPAWSSDVDVHLPAPLDPELPASWGWLPLDPLLGRLGSAGSGRWAATTRDGTVCAAVDLHTTAAPEPVSAVLERCRRRGEVRLREVLELRALVRAGARLPADDPVATVAADVEAGLGGELLRPSASGATLPAPAVLPGRQLVRTAKRSARQVAGPRVVVAVSGVDGAGKSTITTGLVRDLTAAGVPTTVVWTRPGMGMGWLGRLAGRVKGATGQSTEPGVRAMAAGDRPPPRSRQGLLGLLWTLTVTMSFLVAVRRQHLSHRGVLVYDRHLIDALATLRVLYRGVPQGIPTWLVRRLLPRADASLYLDVPADVAATRKPGDTIGAYAVTAQLAEYSQLLGSARNLLVLDATRPRDELQRDALRHVLSVVR